MSNRKVRVKRILSDAEELIDFNDGVSQSVDVVSRNTEIPFGLPQIGIDSDVVAKTGNVYVCTPGIDNTITLTLQNVTASDQGKMVIVRNDDAYDADSYVDIYPQTDDATINGGNYATLESNQAAMFMPRADLNWNMFAFDGGATTQFTYERDYGYTVKVSGTDTEPNYLEPKLIAGSHVLITKLSAAGVETLRISVPSAPTNNDGYLASATMLVSPQSDSYSDGIPANTWVTLADIADLSWDGYGEYNALAGNGEITVLADGYYFVVLGGTESGSTRTIAKDSGNPVEARVAFTKNSVPVSEASIKYDAIGQAVARMYNGFGCVTYAEVGDVLSLGFWASVAGVYAANPSNIIYVAAGLSLHLHRVGSAAFTEVTPLASYKCMVSADDNTPDWLEDKVVGGNRITVSTLNPAGNEDLQIAMDAHASDHENGGSDEISVAGLSGLLADDQNPVNHATDHQSGGGDAIKLDNLATPDDNTDLDATTTEHGLLPKLSNNPGHYLDGQGNWTAPSGQPDLDAYATMDWVHDGYAPLTHASRHESGGADAIKLDDLATPDDNTDLDVSTSRHGLMPKLYDDGYYYLDGYGNWSIPLGASGPHAVTHENGGTDEVDVTGLSGLLADNQNPVAHETSHRNGGSDELNVLGLSGELADLQKPKLHKTAHERGGGLDAIRLDDLELPQDNTDLDTNTGTHGLCPKLSNVATEYLDGQGGWTDPVTGYATQVWVGDGYVTAEWVGDGYVSITDFNSHASRHQNGGADEINVAGLSGELADDQPPKTHATAHQSGGGDAIKLDDLAAPDDNTDLDVSTSAHGLMPKLPNIAGQFLNGKGSWAVPAGGSGSDTYQSMVSADDSTQDYLEGKIIGEGLLDISVDDPGGDEALVISVDLDAYGPAYITTDAGREERTTTGINADDTAYQLNFENGVSSRVSKNISTTNNGKFTFDVAGTYRITLDARFRTPSDGAGRFYIKWKNVTQGSFAAGTFYASHSGWTTNDGEPTGGTYSWIDSMAANDDGYLCVYRKNTTDTEFDMLAPNVHIERLDD